MYSVVDIEGNGGGFRKESIIEVAIYKYDGHKIVDQFISMVNPEGEITPFVQKLTGITPNMVKTAPKFHEIAKRIVEITDGTTLVGHNIDFDYRMLRQSFKKLGYDFKINTLDTIELAKKLIPNESSYSLGKLTKSLGIPLVNAHRASGDALATVELLKLLLSKDTDKEIIQAHHEELNANSYINKIKELTQDLPSEKGIIYFQNKDGKIIFSDYVLDVYKSAKKLFNSRSKKWEKIQSETENISFELTGTDIIAKLMLRNKNIRKKYPLPYGLYSKNESLVVEKLRLNKDLKPILKFKNFSQAEKALQFIQSNDQLRNLDQLLQTIDLKDRNQLLISKGRKLGEKSFLVIENGKLNGFGFYELFNQISSKDIVKKLSVEAKANPEILNEVKLGLLKGDFEIHEFYKK